MDGHEAWDRQPGETSLGYALFAEYRDLGPLERSLGRVARDAGRSLGSVQQLSRRNGWLARAEAWDAGNDRQRRALQAREREQMARRQVLAGQLLMSKAVKRAQTMTDEEVALLSVWEMVRMLEAGVRLERMGRGEPGDLARAYTVQQNLHVNTPDSPIMEILHCNPNRVGPVIEALAKLQELLPEFGAGDPHADGDDDDLAYLLNEEEVGFS